MSFLNSLFARQLVGLDIGVSGIKAVELSGKKSPRLIAYNRIPLPLGTISNEGEILHREILVSALRKLFDFRGFTTKRVAVGASGSAIITRKISVPRMSADELSHQLYWEAEQYLPFNINEVNLDFAILGNSPKVEGEAPKMDVLLVAAKKDYIESLSNLIYEAGLEPEVIDNNAFALGNTFEFNYSHLMESAPQGAMSIIIDFGAGGTKLSAVEGDKTTFARELRQSGIGCTQLLSENLGIAFEQAEKLKILQPDHEAAQGLILEYNQSLVEEIGRTVDFCVGQSYNASVQGIYVCGGASRTLGLVEQLGQKMPAPVQPLNPIQSISGSGRRMNTQAIRELAYLGAVAIGLALRSTGDME